MSEKLTLRVLEDRLSDALASHAQEIDALGQEVATANERLAIMEQKFNALLPSIAKELTGLGPMMSDLEGRIKALERLAVAPKPGSDPMMNELEARVKVLEARPASRSASRSTTDPVRAAAIRAFAPGYARAHKGCTYEEAEAAYDAQQAASAAA